MKKHFAMLFLLLLQPWGAVASDQKDVDGNTIAFQQSPYGLIFTRIIVNGESLLAMIDIGDQQGIQLSSTVAENQALPLEKTGVQVINVHGEKWDVYQGTIASFSLGSKPATELPFTTSPGEIEALAAQLDSEFQAVIGWGYFKGFVVETDYPASVIRLYEALPQSLRPQMSVRYSDDYGPLLFNVLLNGTPQRVMLDTGATVSVFDPSKVPFGRNNEIEFKIDNTPVHLTAYEQDLAVLADLGVVGVLGSDFLNQFNVVIDPFTGHMHFVANPK